MPITGRTRVLAVVGHPLDAARAPEALNRVVSELGLDLVVIPVDVIPEDLREFAGAARGWRNLAGLLATMPHKSALAGLADWISDRATVSGAINVVRRDADGTLHGDQLDGAGFVGSLADAGIVVTKAAAVLLGAGGVARSIAFALAEAGIASLIIANRSQARATALVADLARAYPQLDVAAGPASAAASADILINATSVGSQLQPGIPIDPRLIRPGSVVADVIAKPAMTSLLSEAARRGARTHTGIQMQEAQFRSILAFIGAAAPDPLNPVEVTENT